MITANRAHAPPVAEVRRRLRPSSCGNRPCLPATKFALRFQRLAAQGAFTLELFVASRLRATCLHAVGTVPPSMTNSVPVIAAARGEMTKAISSATSRGFAGRPRGIPPSDFMMICFPPS